MKRNKVAKLMAVVALVGAVGVGGSLALLTAQSNTVNNVFTVGDGYTKNAVYIDETDITERTKRTQIGNTYTDIQEGDILTKDPQVHIAKENCKSYVFVKVEGLQAMKDVNVTVDWNENWKKVDQKVASADTIYVYCEKGAPAIVDPEENGWSSEKLFTKLNFSEADLIDETNNTVKTFNNIVVKACAVQATTMNEGIETMVTYNEAKNMVKFS